MKHLKLITTASIVGATVAFVSPSFANNPSRTTATSTPSAMDQTQGTGGDVEVTRSIREGLTKDNRLSTSAKNVEVVTLGDTITLRGEVNSQAEKDQVYDHAKLVGGNRSIQNEITVK